MRMPVAVRALVAKYWLPSAIYGGVVLAFGWLLWWQLGTLTGGYSLSELNAYNASLHLKDIYHFPVNAPFTLLTHALQYLHRDSLLVVRVAATVAGLATLTAFYWLVRYWHGQRAAIFGTVLFGTSAWFLHTARLGTPDVLMFGVLGLTACGVWFKHSRTALPVVLLLTLVALLLYVPGMVWFILAGVIWQLKTIDRVFKQHLWMVSVGAVLFLAILAPLGLAISHSPEMAKIMVGLPAGWPSPLHVLENLARVPFQFVFRGPLDPQHWLGRLPILDAFSLGMIFLGIYVYIKHAKLIRTQLMVVILLIGTGLVALGGAVSLSIIVPFVYILAAAGIGLLIDRWYTVFPRNPIARGVGAGLMSLAVLASCWYGYRHYFVAWPNAPETKPVFTIAGKR
jgi:hypothetical protein